MTLKSITVNIAVMKQRKGFKAVTIRFSEKAYKAMKQLSDDYQCSMTAVVNRAVIEAMRDDVADREA